jgi:hypothetical protein
MYEANEESVSEDSETGGAQKVGKIIKGTAFKEAV